MPSDPVFRLARATIFAAVCVALAVMGHATASHAAVPPGAVVVGLAGLTVVATMLAGTERSLGTILAGLLGGQFMLHVLFAVAQHGQHLAHQSASAMPHGGAGPMTLAHVTAALVAAWWLRRGERAVWRLARKVAAAAVRPLRALLSPPAPPPARRPPYIPVIPGAALPDEVLRHVLTRRGPPSPSPAFR